MREFNPAFAGRTEGEIELREHQLSDALRTKNGDEVGRILGERVLISGILGERKALIFLFTSLNENKYFSIEKSEMRIEVYGDMAVSTGVQKSDIDLENGSRFSQTNFINTWKRIDGIWRCVAMGS